MGLLNLKVPSREDFRSERIVLREESSNSADPRFWNFSCMRGKRSGRIFKSVVKHSTAVLLSVGPERMRWNTRPATATKLGFPGVGNACDDSIEAKEKIRFNFRDSFGVSGERRKTSNSGGGWGRRWTAERRLPSWPQQNPGFSPVRSSMRHLGHRLSAARLFEDEPQVKRGVKIGLITQVSDLVYVGGFVTSIGEHGIMIKIYTCSRRKPNRKIQSGSQEVHTAILRYTLSRW